MIKSPNFIIVINLLHFLFFLFLSVDCSSFLQRSAIIYYIFVNTCTCITLIHVHVDKQNKRTTFSMFYGHIKMHILMHATSDRIT